MNAHVTQDQPSAWVVRFAGLIPAGRALDLAAGPQQMLVSGQWDATGQLLAHGEQLAATVARLPYLQGFAAV